MVKRTKNSDTHGDLDVARFKPPTGDVLRDVELAGPAYAAGSSLGGQEDRLADEDGLD